MGWPNETDLGDEDTWDFLAARLGRYPRAGLLPPDAVRPKFMIGDMNTPDIGSWAYEKFHVHLPERYKLYRQPSGFSEDVENVKGSKLHQAGWGAANDPGYYEDLAVGKPKWFVERYIKAKPGYSRSGEPVYEAFDEERHIARKVLEPIPELPVICGFDQDHTPGAAWFQPMPNGQMRVLEDLFLGKGVGPNRFAEHVHEVNARRFHKCMDLRYFADPASQYGGDQQDGTLAWIEAMMLAMNAPIMIPAGGNNELAPRIGVLDTKLRMTVGDNEPGMLISPNCRWIIEGFAAKYRWLMQKTGGDTKRAGIVKNNHSHPMEGLQYAGLGYYGLIGVIDDMARAGRPGNVRGGRAPAGTPNRNNRGNFDVHNLGRGR